MAEFMGWQKYIQIKKESTFGTDPGSGDIYVPYTTCDISTKVQSSQAELFNGIRHRRHNRVFKANVDGTLAMPLWAYHVSSKSIAQHLIETAISAPTGISLDSWTIDRYEAAVDNKRFTGCRINTMEIAGDADSGNVTMSLGIIGKQEAGGVTVTAVSSTAPQPLDFVFSDVEFFLSSESEGESATGTGDALSIRSFRISVNNNLQVYHTDNYWPSVIPCGKRTVDFQFSFFNTANTYDAIRRASTATNRAANLKLTTPHGGTGAGVNTVMDVYFDKLNFANATDSAGLNELSNQSVDWIVLKPSTSEQEIEFAFSTTS